MDPPTPTPSTSAETAASSSIEPAIQRTQGQNDLVRKLIPIEACVCRLFARNHPPLSLIQERLIEMIDLLTELTDRSLVLQWSGKITDFWNQLFRLMPEEEEEGELNVVEEVKVDKEQQKDPKSKQPMGKRTIDEVNLESDDSDDVEVIEPTTTTTAKESDSEIECLNDDDGDGEPARKKQRRDSSN